MFSYAESALGRPAFLRDLNAPLLFWGHSRASVYCEERRKLLYFNLLNEHHLGRESIVQLEQRQTLSQKLVLTQTMRQSLDCLQLSAPELAEYVQEVALSNPLLDVQSPPITRPSSPARPLPPSVNRSRCARRTRGAASPPPVWRMCRTSPPF
ncbi:MAG: hypothetical protein ACM678_00870 [Clostridiales bacterium]